MQLCTGCYELNDALLSCHACGCQLDSSCPFDAIDRGFWPGSPQRGSKYLFDLHLLQYYNLLQLHCPGLSETGFLKSLTMFSANRDHVSCVPYPYLSYSILFSKNCKTNIFPCILYFSYIVNNTNLSSLLYLQAGMVNPATFSNALMSGDISTLKYSATRGLMGLCVLAARTISTLYMLMGTRSYTIMQKFTGTGTALSVCYYLQYMH